MKKLFYLFLTSILLTVFSFVSNAQCNAHEFSNDCVPLLPNEFNFLKSYKIDGIGGSKDKIEYSYVFTKGTQYMINICSEKTDTDGIVISLFDSQRTKVGSNEHEGQKLSAIAYPCNSTGIYYISYTFAKSSKYCGGSALGFKR